MPMKICRLRANRLILLAVLGEQRGNCRRHLVGGAGAITVVADTAAAFAALTAEPMPAKSRPAAAIKSGPTTKYDIANPYLRCKDVPVHAAGYL